ncbi:Siroheme synthase [Methyloligella halotolerans]|uniref:Siroheme synthase n=1 Tax=Methyloligella halotolerans TaxID=1177755 RepID=A0A1E2RYF3_9HYPH|nr:siroheme synthase CysG [Methyloligella halotolerans]ODA67079.1 Siroheme synthase [Methyloligella halotolerans]
MRTFPVFLRVDGKPPLVAGGGDLAGVKARLVLKRAPLVEIAADRLDAELSRLEAEGKVRRIEPMRGIDQIRGRPLVVSATEDDDEDARVSAIARALGVPVNVPDRPELCTFALAAIVDRDEVTVAIGTEGLAPVLAQRLRAGFERELHPRLGSLARLAGTFRDRVAAQLPEGPARRNLWDRIFGGPAGQAALDGDETEAGRLFDQEIDAAVAGEQESKGVGRVLMVGGGPGDPDLLTLKAVRALKAADIILYDGLVGEGVLEHARREALLIPVAKAKGAHSVSQENINRLMVEHAKQGHTVVRLKGGDPFVFGRGGEELDALREAGIAVEVVPGITAAVAAAASVQIPLTHRDHSHSVTFVSGHAAKSDRPDFDGIDLTALAGGGNTLVLYMGVSTSGEVAGQLLAAGWSPETPVLAVENATRSNERRVACRLSILARSPERLQLASPAVLFFGEVAGLEAEGLVDRVLDAPALQGAFEEIMPRRAVNG